MKVCLRHPGLVKCHMIWQGCLLALVHNALWLELLGQPCASGYVPAHWLTVLEPGATDKVPGIGGLLKELVASSLTPRCLSLPPFPVSHTLWSLTLWAEGYVGWPGKQGKEQRPDTKKPRQDGQSMSVQFP